MRPLKFKTSDFGRAKTLSRADAMRLAQAAFDRWLPAEISKDAIFVHEKIMRALLKRTKTKPIGGL